MTTHGSEDARPSEGSDPSGAVSVTIDASYRVSDVRVVDRPEARTPDGLAQAVAGAYEAAMAARLERLRALRPPRPAGERPVPVATLLTVRRPTAEDLTRHRIRKESPTLPQHGDPGEVTGVSRNDCVHVTLPPAQPRGTVTADPGWLANAQTANIASALVEAFTDAYRQRDHA